MRHTRKHEFSAENQPKSPGRYERMVIYMKKRVILFLLLIILTFFLPGCYDFVRLDALSIVSGFGVDWDKEKQEYKVSTLISKTSSDKDSSVVSVYAEETGKSIIDTTHKIFGEISGQIYSNHCDVVVIGEALAERGIKSLIDTLFRIPDMEKEVDVVIAKESEASDILKAKSKNSPITTAEIKSILKSENEFLGENIVMSLLRLDGILSDGCLSAVIPAFSFSDEEKENIKIAGCAVFSGDRLAGYLNEEDNRLVALMQNGKTRAAIFNKPEPDSQFMTAGIRKYKSEITPKMNDGLPGISVYLKGDITVLETEGMTVTKELFSNEQALQKEFENALNDKMTFLIGRLQNQFGCDIFGFSNAFRNVYRKEWRDMESDWTQIFRSLKVTVSSDLKMINTNLSME